MTQLFQDAMAICKHFHKPDLFLTITANPKWPEIVHSLFPSQTATDHPNIISQVFEQKKKALLKLIDNVMNIEQNYNYYQLWSNNEWLVDEILAMLDEDITIQ